MRLQSSFTIVLITLSTALGCYTTTLRSGKPAEPASVEYDEKWHHGLVWGIAELSGPYNLQHVCPNGWASIKTETSFLNGLVEAVTSGVYSPQTVTVQCARSTAARAPTEPLRPLAAAEADEAAKLQRER